MGVDLTGLRVERLESDLTTAQRFRLIEIAHETTDRAVKEAALKMLHDSRPLLMAGPHP